jgi:transcriptional regulator with XRE-family HTH domain
MEKLQTYLIGKNKGEFARAIGKSPSYLSQILSGYRKPSLALMNQIAAATGGVVDLNSWADDGNHPPAEETAA